MNKTAVEIIEEAPVSAKYGEKLSLYCSNCPWWTNNWKDARTKECLQGKVVVCPKCDHPLKEAPLEWYISQHRPLPIEDYQKFLACFASGTHWNPQA